MKKFLESICLSLIVVWMMIPVLGFQKHFAIVNMFIDLPVFMSVNLILCIYFLETEVRKFKYISIFLLVLACVTVFSAFLRIIPLPAGLTLSFLIPVAAGIVFGPSFGFLVGQISMMMGGLIMGAIGPWLPYQSLTMGTVAYFAGIFFEDRNKDTGILFYICIVSIFYGYILSTTYWPMAVEVSDISSDWMARVISYSKYYFVTSFIWDLSRVVGNIFLFGFLFREICELLRRGKQRLIKIR